MSKRDNSYCCVPQCNTAASKYPNLSFHKFPKGKANGDFASRRELLRRMEWKRVLRIGKTISDRSVVCSKHFRPKDFFSPGVKNKRRRLKKNVVPSLDLPLCSTEEKLETQENEKRYVPIAPYPQNQALKQIKVITVDSKTWIPSKISTICLDSLSENQMDCSSLPKVKLRENDAPDIFKTHPSYLENLFHNDCDISNEAENNEQEVICSDAEFTSETESRNLELSHSDDEAQHEKQEGFNSQMSASELYDLLTESEVKNKDLENQLKSLHTLYDDLQERHLKLLNEYAKLKYPVHS